MITNKNIEFKKFFSLINNVLKSVVSNLPLLTFSTIYKNLTIKISNENFRPILIIIISLLVFIIFSLLYLNYFLSADMVDLRKEIVDLEFMYNEVLKKNSGLEQKNILFQQLLEELSINKETHLKKVFMIALGVGLSFGFMYVGYSVFSSKLIIPVVGNLANTVNGIILNLSDKIDFGFVCQYHKVADEKGIEYVVLISKETLDILVKLSDNNLVTITQYLDCLEKFVFSLM